MAKDKKLGLLRSSNTEVKKKRGYKKAIKGARLLNTDYKIVYMGLCEKDLNHSLISNCENANEIRCVEQYLY